MSGPDPETLYVALIGAPGRLRDMRRLTYRCERRCLLLDALAVPEPEHILLHQKRYKNSEQINRKRSNAAGRAASTYDGNNHWMPRSYYLGASSLAYPDDRPTPMLSVQCDHVGVLPDGGEVTLSARDFHDDWEAGHAEVRVRPDGTRYAIH